jgi:MoaA/NifB/PqqE/SkfB family radical SAM enzyme
MRTFPNVPAFIASAAFSALVGRRVLNCLWELTYRCNASCQICGYWQDPSDPEEELTLSEIQAGLERIHAYGCKLVNFTGGEPTLRKDLEEIVSHASRLGMWTSMVTNGSLLTRKRIGQLKDAGLDNLLVSLDSLDPEVHNAQRGLGSGHAKVMNCLRWLREDFLTGHRTGGIFCALSSENAHQADALVEFADEAGVYVAMQPYHENKTGSTEFNADINDDMVARLLRLKRERKNMLNSTSFLSEFSRFHKRDERPPCHAGRKYFSVDPYGFLHPCVDMPSAGHVLKDGISVVRSTDALRSVNSCQGCWYCFRGEADSSLSVRGCFEKVRLGMTVINRNSRLQKTNSLDG